MQKKLSVDKKTLNCILWSSLLLAFIFFLFIYIINCKTPLMGEDYVLTLRNYYMSEFPPDVNLFTLIFERIVVQMTGWNVRLGEQLAIIMLAFDKSIYNLLSIFVIFWFFILHFYYGANRFPQLAKKEDVAALLFCVTVTFCLSEYLGEVFFWCTGSLNYLWPLTLLLTTAIPIRKYLGGKVIRMNIFAVILYGVICFIAAFGNENTTPVVIACLFFVILVEKFIRKKHIPSWLYVSFLAYGLGWLCLMGAPSTRFRQAYYRQSFGLPENTTISEIIGNFVRVSKTSFEVTWKYAVVSFLLLLLLYIIKKSTDKKDFTIFSKEILVNIFMLMLSLISLAALCFAPYMELRSTMIVHFFILSLDVSIILRVCDGGKEIKHYRGFVVITVIAMLVSTGVVCNQIYVLYSDYSAFDKNRTMGILAEAQSGTKEIYVEQKNIRNRLMNNREDYILEMNGTGLIEYSRYFKADSIQKITSVSISEEELYAVGYSNASSLGYLEWIRDGQNTEAGWRLTQNLPITLAGWAVNATEQQAISKVYIQINDRYYPCEMSERPDVVKHFNNKEYLLSGFMCTIAPKEVPVGKYQLNIVGIDEVNKQILKQDIGSLEIYT